MPGQQQYELTDAEKRDLTRLINEGRPLPEKYRFILFEDKREIELVWPGKTREVCNTVLPFQTLEHIDEPRKEAGERTGDLMEVTGAKSKGWTNKLIWGDNKLILSSLKSGALRQQIEDAGGLKLIYIDPPFDVGADFSMDIEIGGETFHKEPNILEQIAYRDTWGRGADSFIAMIYERLILMRDLMHPEGSIFVHCDWHVSHLLRTSLDDVFGASQFCNEIVWHYYNKMQGNVNRFASNHDVIFWYSMGEHKRFERQFDARPETVRQIKRAWDQKSKKLVNAKGADGKVIYIETDRKSVDDVWRLSMLQPADRTENLGYATQKPETLATRILSACSGEGDLVADFFCGSGTVVAVAEKLGRRWLASDLGKFAIHTSRKRLIETQRQLKSSGKGYRPFEVLNLGRYERQAYLNIPGRLTGKQREQAIAKKEHDFRELILRAYKAEPLDGDSFFHGKLGGRLVVVGPINLPVGRLFVEELVTECRKRGASRADVLAFEFEMGLFPAVLEEAKAKGVDLAPKTIPPEVFDKRAVEKGQVRFADVSYIEVKVVHDPKNKRRVAVQLTDYSVYYSQGIAAAIEAELKEGKSEVICDQGKLIKMSKDKDGKVKREVLTKKWTDWVDYWAVDFDYESRPEIVRRAVELGAKSTAGHVAQAGSDLMAFEDYFTGNYIFENEWQSFRTRQNRELELKTSHHEYEKTGRYKIAVKVVDIFGNDTMKLIPVDI